MTQEIPIGIVFWGKERTGKSTIVNIWSNTPQPDSYGHHEPRKIEMDYPYGKHCIFQLKFFDVAAENMENKTVTMATHNKSGPIQIFVMSAEEENDDVNYCRGLIESPMWNGDEIKLTVIILNKMDIQNNDNEEQLKPLLEKYPNILFFKTSIKDEENIKQCLVTIVQKYIEIMGIKIKQKSKKSGKKEKEKKEKSEKKEKKSGKKEKDKTEGCHNQ